MSQQIARALVSVSEKAGIVEFCHALHELGIELISSGGTARLLHDGQVPVIDVADYTGFPEMMGGRVKTLHPKVHGGILGRRGIDDAVMASHGIPAIDLVVVNLYPFEQTISQQDCSFASAIENIDVGGPAMLRAAAKNHQAVAVVVEPDDYATVLDEIRSNKGFISDTTRLALAAKAFRHTAWYDAAIAEYLEAGSADGLPDRLQVRFTRALPMRYGENPHQHAAFYSEPRPAVGTIARAEQIQGKELSFNNIADADAALECVKSFTGSPACVIVKHANPCGVAQAPTTLEAYRRAYECDPTSAFGGIIAFNTELDRTTAEYILEQQFVEVIIAPGFDEAARSVLSRKPNVRALNCHSVAACDRPQWDYRRVTGGLLVQERDVGAVDSTKLRVVTRRAPNEREWNDLLFAWKVVRYVKSNAIVYCRDQRTVGVGAGQMSRVYSARIAALKAADVGLPIEGSVVASDAFFPFRDGIDAAAAAGVSAVIQPGGSVRDDEVTSAADEHGMTMVFTGVRHFRH